MAVATSSRFLDDLKHEIATSQWSSVQHPLVQGVSKGTVPMQQIRGWAIQDSHYRRMVHRLATLRYLRCNTPCTEGTLSPTVEAKAHDVTERLAARIPRSSVAWPAWWRKKLRA